MKKVNKNRIVFKSDDTIQVFRKGKTTNKKIAAKNETIIQTYTFSVDQFNYVKNHLENNTKPIFKEFFNLDSANCMDCIFSGNMRSENSNLLTKCYTHKVMQYSGFISMLKSIVNEFGSVDNINNAEALSVDFVQNFAKGLYIRFGSYGEPSMHPLNIVRSMTEVSKSWTGYTHQYFRKPEFNEFFVASTHNQIQANKAKNQFNYRSFIAYSKEENISGIICPASNEGGNVTNCSACGLCSGNAGKGKKDIKIILH